MDKDKKIAIRAKYKTKNCMCDGYICILGKTIEGVFGVDYAKIEFKENSFLLFLHENLYTLRGKNLYMEMRDSVFESTPLYESELYSPEHYLLFNGDTGMSLDLFNKETDFNKIEDAFKQLEKIRPSN